jgi:lactoylglutathione lyase
MIKPILRVFDVETSLAFYTRLLGFNGEAGLPGEDDKPIYAEAYLGEAQIIFSQRANGRRFGEGGIELYVEMPEDLDFDHLYSRLWENGVFVVEDMREEVWGDRVFTILDPDCNRVVVAQRIRRAA